MEYFPGFTSLEILQKIQNDLQERNIELEDFGDRTMFMSMFNDIDWTRRDSRRDTGRSSVLETKRSGMEDEIINLKENGILLLHKWCNDSRKQVTQFFTSVSALSREIQTKLKGKETTIHHNTDTSNTDL